MTKQVKIGFDQIPTPSEPVLEVLLDRNGGRPLLTSAGLPLYTQEIASVSNFGSSKNAMPIYVNTEDDGALIIEEQFPETSQVSSSLLGIPRSETQLGLFSDVSTYGIDRNIWEYFRTPLPQQPIEWSTRKNPTYAARAIPELIEFSDEQALSLTAFPVQWTYPFGPRFDEVGLYNQALYQRYINFVLLGNILYSNYAATGQLEFARDNFISVDYATVDVVDGAVQVVYNEETYSIEEIFEQIEKWTLAWTKMVYGVLLDSKQRPVRFQGTGFDDSNTAPGYRANNAYYAQLESKKVFRYQPGRISGFTFGVRASTDPGSFDNIIEWGCANDTDEYMFQIKGAQFNIVRRSVIPLPSANLARMGLTDDDQQLRPVSNTWRSADYAADSGMPTSSPTELYETVIGRDFFNGDKLDGNGQSGHTISFEQVTMYKIEYSWYGAIGAKFYAYVPVDNGDARWVLIHTLVIENELGKPCLKDPFFKFRYLISLKDTSKLTYPQYIYKYGASYYIDGGDEGTTTSNTYSSNANTISTTPRSLLGILPKDLILNRDGVGTKNRKDILPTAITVTSEVDARLDIIECEGCQGYGHHYAPSLHNGVRGELGTLYISNDGTTATFEPQDVNSSFVINDIKEGYTKVIADGLYDVYLSRDEVTGNVSIARRSGNSRINNEVSVRNTYSKTDKVQLLNGTEVPVKGMAFEVRLTNYSDIIASVVPLTKQNIKINFLNPGNLDGRHFTDYFIGITNKEPTTEFTELGNELRFDGQPLDLTTLLFAEHTHYSARKSVNGVDNSEHDPRVGNIFEADPRLRTPAGVDSGRCAQARISVNEVKFDVTFSSTNPVNPLISGTYLIFTSRGILDYENLAGGGVAVPSNVTGLPVASDITFVSNSAVPFLTDNVTKYFVEISGPLPDVSTIYFKSLTLVGRFVRRAKVFPWDTYPLYVVIGMRDAARINNITIEEYDDSGKFSYTPTWVSSDDCQIEVVPSGNSSPGDPATNFVAKNRLDSAQIDSQLQQPLRPGVLRSSVFVGANETVELGLEHLFGQDRNVITPGIYNTNATFVTARSISDVGEIQININTKEQ